MSDENTRNAVEGTKAHYAHIFSRFKSDVADGSLQFETKCLAYELGQIKEIPESGFVLDAGCGTGRYAAAWRTLRPSATLIGVDINRVILKDGLVTDALAPINGNLEALPFKSDSFDVVMSRGALPATPEPRQAVSEMLRVCKPGGLFYFYTYRFGFFDVVLYPLRFVAKALGRPFCARVLYALSRRFRLDARVPAMILDELFAPIRNAPSERTVIEWLHSSRVSLASVERLVHAQDGNIRLPVDRRTALLYRILPKIGVIALAVRKAER